MHRLQKMEAIGTLAAGVAHDFNNLLTIIGGHVSLILDMSPLTTEDRDALEQVRTAVNRAAKLTQQLLVALPLAPEQQQGLRHIGDEPVDRALQRIGPS